LKQGRLQLGNEAAPVEYELHTEWHGKRRLITGRCVIKQNPSPQLLNALTQLTGANLLTNDGQVCHVEFTKNTNGREIEFSVLPPTGFVVNS
jgi:hypothetical protein